MIVTRTPYRISLAGGGSDFSEHFNEHGGSVIGFAIQQYCNIFVRKLPPYFEYDTRIVWSKIEHVNNVEDIEHPAVRAVLLQYDSFRDLGGLSILHEGDLPARSGMGSSSSFVVGLLRALYALYGYEYCDKEALAISAINIERNVMEEPGGWQDQIFAAYGGFHRINFKDNEYTVHPIYLSPARIKYMLDHLMLVFTSLQRNAWEIEGEKIKRATSHTAEFERLRQSVQLVEAALRRADYPDMQSIAEVMNFDWRIKKSLADNVSNIYLDDIHERALASGAWGGKLLGAGGGGYFLFIVPPDARERVKEALGHPIEVPIKIDYYGSRVMHLSPNGDR